MEIIKLMAEINNIETQKTIQRINDTKSWFLEKINKINKTLSELIKLQRKNTQINKIRNEMGDITTDTGNSENHQILLQKLVCHKIGKCERNGQF